MPRAPQSRQPGNGAGRQPSGRDRGPDDADPADRQPGRIDDERSPSVHRLRDDRDDRDDDDHRDDDDGRAYDYGEGRELLAGGLGRPPPRDDRDDEPVTEADLDIMEVLDLDDLYQMDGPDA